MRLLIYESSNQILKKLLQYAFLILAAFATACGSLKTADSINVGFEKVTDDITPDGWVANNLPQTKKYAELSVDNSVFHSGNKSIKISISENHPAESTTYNWVRRLDKLDEEKIYELAGWVKMIHVKNPPFIELEFWNNNKLIGTASSSIKNFAVETKKWQEIKTIFKVPKSTSKIFIRAGIKSFGNSGGKVWFDDIKITKTE